MRISLVLFAVLVVLVVSVGCRPTYFADAVPYPQGCEQLSLEPARCAALVDAARAELGLPEADVAAVHLLTEDRCEADRSILCSRSGTLALPVRFTLNDGSFRWIALGCTIDVPRPYC